MLLPQTLLFQREFQWDSLYRLNLSQPYQQLKEMFFRLLDPLSLRPLVFFGHEFIPLKIDRLFFFRTYDSSVRHIIHLEIAFFLIYFLKSPVQPILHKSLPQPSTWL